MKIDYNYPAKRSIRERVLRFMQKSIPNPSQAKVICFPGAQALEITEIYDPLGVPRSHIAGIERNPEIFELLQKKNLGIHLFKGEATDAFSRVGEVDIVSLDYTSLPSLETIRIVRNLFKNSQLSDRSVLYTNFYASRMNDFTLFNLPYVSKYQITESGPKSKRVVKTEMSRYMWSDAPQHLGVSLKQFRSDGLTYLLLLAARGDDFLDFCLAQKKVRSVDELFKDFPKTKDSPLLKEKLESCIPLLPCSPQPDGKNFSCNNGRLSDIFRSIAYRFIETKQKIDLPYAVTGLERYEYVSDDGSLMYSDLLSFDGGDVHKKAFKDAIQGVCEHETIICKGTGNERIRNRRILEKNANEWAVKTRLADLFLKKLPSRSNITPPLITKDQAITFLREGKYPSFLANHYRGFTIGQLAAFQAHITMGTYDSPISTHSTHSTIASPELTSSKPSFVRGLLDKGVFIFDSYGLRLQKNASRIVSPVSLTTLCLLRGHDSCKGLDFYLNKHKGLFVFNTFDDSSFSATSLLCQIALESPFHHYLYFLGSPHDLISKELEAARSLGAKIHTGTCNLSTSFLDPQKPFDLESIILD